MRRIVAIVALFASLSTSPVLAQTWPALSGDGKHCQTALEIAKIVFAQDDLVTYAPPKLPPTFSNTLLVKPEGIDISGGDGAIVDLSVFTRLYDEQRRRPFYWQTAPKGKTRLVIRLWAMGWRGDRYSIGSVPVDLSPEDFLIKNPNEADDHWRPPLVLRDDEGEIWSIIIDHPAKAFPRWEVYISDEDGEWIKQCEVHMGPVEKTPVQILPPAVRKLAVLLDGAIGDGKGEGTLRPTGRIRTNVGHLWAAAALRPWAALSANAYNTREEVDTALLVWAKPVKSFYKLYQDIQTQYPTAQKALTDYYVQRFGYSRKQAQETAAYILDVAYRRHFTFSKKRTD